MVGSALKRDNINGDAREHKPVKYSVLRWHGIIPESNTLLRCSFMLLLTIGILSLSFTQLGFVSIGKTSSYFCYAIVLLAPVSAAALLFGCPRGAAVGLFAGACAYAHSILQPLDAYEMFYVTLPNSIVLFAVMGAIMGLAFSITLRKDPPLLRRVISIALISILGSWIASTLFISNVLIQCVFVATGTLNGSIGSATWLMLLVSNLGSTNLQIAIDAALVFIACLVSDLSVRWYGSLQRNQSLIAIFRGWLLFGVALTFMITAAAAFVTITESARAQATATMLNEIDFLDEQIADRNERGLTLDGLLRGYRYDLDGGIFILQDGVVIDSDTDDFEPGDNFTPISRRNVMPTTQDEKPTMSMVFYSKNDKLYSAFDGIDLLTEEGSEQFNRALEQTRSEYEDGVTSELFYVMAAERQDYQIAVMYPSSMIYENRTSTMWWSTSVTLVLLATASVIATILLRRIVLKNIDETNRVLDRITAGNLNEVVEARNSREFSSLAAGINTTVDALKASIAEAASRMDSELAAAKAIQESALPRIFPPYPNIMHFDIYASMQPAREVGGDFYDFFLVHGKDEGKLGFAIADVSGKGVPAALFMMSAQSHLRNYIESGIDLDEAITSVNHRLCDGNDAGMFVTVFVGVLDYRTGKMRYVNAGHNPPLLRQNGNWSWLKDKSGLPLGLFDELPYRTFECQLTVGDELLLYTDGVTEAMTTSKELYGESRLAKLVNSNVQARPNQLIAVIRDDIATFTEGTEQSDDITMLALEYGAPPENAVVLTVQASDEELRNVKSFIRAELDLRACPVKTRKQITVALEELFVNICHYAYPDATPDNPGIAHVSCVYSANPPSMTVELVDEGIAFNPLEKTDAITPDNIMDVPIGGLGILMAKKSVDEMYYERRGESNVLTFTKHW